MDQAGGCWQLKVQQTVDIAEDYRAVQLRAEAKRREMTGPSIEV
jgi:hypothetical protein